MITGLIRSSIATAAVVMTLSALSSVSAAEFKVQMLDNGPDHPNQFDPELVKVSPGDTIHFFAMDEGHSVESIPSMIPEGTAPFSGDLGQTVTVTLMHEGVYGFQCGPHGAGGMVGMIVVGHPTNEDAAKHAIPPGLANRIFAKLFQALDTGLAAGK